MRFVNSCKIFLRACNKKFGNIYYKYCEETGRMHPIYTSSSHPYLKDYVDNYKDKGRNLLNLNREYKWDILTEEEAFVDLL